MSAEGEGARFAGSRGVSGVSVAKSMERDGGNENQDRRRERSDAGDPYQIIRNHTRWRRRLHRDIQGMVNVLKCTR